MAESDTRANPAETKVGRPEPAVGGIRGVVVFVDDLEQARDFYVGTLGLEKRGEEVPAPGLQTLEVALPGAATSLLLVRPSLDAMGADEATRAHDRIGEPTGVVLEVEDLAAAQAELRRRGVEFVTAPGWQALGGRASRFRDAADNELLLVEAAAH